MVMRRPCGRRIRKGRTSRSPAAEAWRYRRGVGLSRPDRDRLCLWSGPGGRLRQCRAMMIEYCRTGRGVPGEIQSGGEGSAESGGHGHDQVSSLGRWVAVDLRSVSCRAGEFGVVGEQGHP